MMGGQVGDRRPTWWVGLPIGEMGGHTSEPGGHVGCDG